MKQYILLLIFFFTGFKMNAQFSPTLSDIIESKRKANGKVIALKDSSGVQLSITYKNRKVSSIEALDKNNTQLKVVYETTAMAKAKGTINTEPILCKVCITKTDGTIIKCWDINCSDIPSKKA